MSELTFRGYINADGTIKTASPNVTCSKTGQGVYQVSFPPNGSFFNTPAVVVSVVSGSGLDGYTLNEIEINGFTIATKDSSGTYSRDLPFCFVAIGT